ncbi:alpha/beta fold hydrolase [Cellulomonas soli]
MPQDLGGVLANVAGSYAPSAGGAGRPGTSEAAITVQRIDHPDGTRSWAVEIPGTQQGSPAAAVPTDLSTNLQLMARQRDDMTAAVIEAMRAAGVGPDEPVLLAGHSQGGMVAMSVASATVGTFAVKAVVTAGSPDLPGPPPPGVQVLAIRHTADLVPQVDGLPDHGTSLLTVVERDLEATGETDVISTIEAHSVSRYVETAEMLPDAVGADPGYQRFMDVAAPILGQEGATAVTTQYDASRAPSGS